MEIGNSILTIKLAKDKLNLVNMLPIGRSTLTGNVVVLEGNLDLIKKITKLNTTYCICSKYDLHKGTLTMPKGSSLEFRGGVIHNGTIVGNNSSIIADTKVLDNINIEGTWRCVGNVAWWAKGSSFKEISWLNANGEHKSAFVPDNYDDYTNILQALDSSFRELIFPPKMYYTSHTLTLSKEKKLVLQGSSMGNGIGMLKVDNIYNTAVVYTDKDIDLLVINVTECGNSPCTVSIEGGNFDVSRIVSGGITVPYTHSCIKVLADDYNARLWGLNIDTNIFGSGHDTPGTSIGININPTAATPKYPYNQKDYGYVTRINIKGSIHKMGTAIVAKNHHNSSNETTNWASGLDVDCNISFCRKAVVTDTDCDIKGLIQSDHIHTANNTDAMIDIQSIWAAAIGANIFDINNKKDTARYAVNILHPLAKVLAYGQFAATCKNSSDQLWTGNGQLIY